MLLHFPPCASDAHPGHCAARGTSERPEQEVTLMVAIYVPHIKTDRRDLLGFLQSPFFVAPLSCIAYDWTLLLRLLVLALH